MSDTGRGMDQATRDHIFEPFFTTKEPGKGTGLGLSIVYGVVTQSRGHIQVESEIDAGSVFTIHFPRVFETAEDTSERAEEEYGHAPASILLVEDESSVRRLFRKVLERHGYTVTEAGSGEEAIRVCRVSTEGFDLLITDIVLTGMRGREIAAAVRHFFPRIPIIYMSGYGYSSEMASRENAPFLRKPFSSSELLAQVRETLAGRLSGRVDAP
jgi:two-component system cell cycle sensor histidine kinase/response regulator CckA